MPNPAVPRLIEAIIKRDGFVTYASYTKERGNTGYDAARFVLRTRAKRNDPKRMLRIGGWEEIVAKSWTPRYVLNDGKPDVPMPPLKKQLHVPVPVQPSEEWALDYLKKHGSISQHTYARAKGVTAGEGSRVLRAMRAKELIREEYFEHLSDRGGWFAVYVLWDGEEPAKKPPAKPRKTINRQHYERRKVAADSVTAYDILVQGVVLQPQGEDDAPEQ